MFFASIPVARRSGWLPAVFVLPPELFRKEGTLSVLDLTIKPAVGCRSSWDRRPRVFQFRDTHSRTFIFIYIGPPGMRRIE
jgi:hypothetical protein